jgi:DNA-binding LacI/PurR family transcriptional regulator
MPPSTHKSSREKVRDYRARLREQGLRPIQIWVPDTSSPEFRAEARRQCLAVANSANAAEDQEFVDAASSGVWDDE